MPAPASRPPPSRSPAATPTSVNFWGDLTGASTTLTANANVNDTTLNVVEASGFTAGDIIYLINTDQFSTVTVGSAAGTVITIGTPGVPVAYSQGVQVGRPSWSASLGQPPPNPQGRREGAGLQPLATGVTA